MQQEQSQQGPDQTSPSPGPAPPATGPVLSPPGRRYRSLFWAIVLIAVGVVALLFSLDVMKPASLGMLGYVWPVIIIGAGVDLLVGRRSLLAGAVVGVVTVGVIVALMAVGPSLGWTEDPEVKTDSFATPVGEATSAKVAISTGGYSVDLRALPSAMVDPDRPMFEASVAYRGSVDFQSSGSVEKTVSLEARGQRWWWSLLDLTDAATWDIGLDPVVPLDLVVDSSSGSVKLDAGKLNLTDLEANMSSGDMSITLPDRGGEAYEATARVSSGDLEVGVAPGARIGLRVSMSSGDVHVFVGTLSKSTVTFDGSSGQFTLEMASDQAFRLEVRNVSSGSIGRPPGMVLVTEGERGAGIWETAGYSSAEDGLLLIVEHMSSGSVTIERRE